jgi:translation initiation factor 1 (eIF-1/SUI1)
MTKKLIHVGALDSLFESGQSLLEKMGAYEQSIKLIEFEEKMKAYDEKIANHLLEDDERSAKRTSNLKAKLIEKGPGETFVDDFYASLKFKHKLDYLVKKSIFPTMNLDLISVLKKDSKLRISTGKDYDLIMDRRGKDVVLISGEHLQRIDSTDVKTEAKFCVPGYVMTADEFTYQGGTRKALKMIIDSSGYVSEKVLWPDYNTGILEYPENLKEGSIAYFIYSKKPGKPYTNINEIIIEENTIKD